MVPEEEFLDSLEIVEKFHDKVVAGSIVECGTWRGGMLGGIGILLGPGLDYVGADSFQGLPEAGELDGEAAKQWQAEPDKEGYFDNCAAAREDFDRAMIKAELTGVRVLHCWFENTLPTAEFSNGIGLLRLDGDWFESTLTCLQTLFPKVNPGGVIVIDDYAAWDGCSRAVHKYLADQMAPEKIRSWNGRVCYIVKENETRSGTK